MRLKMTVTSTERHSSNRQLHDEEDGLQSALPPAVNPDFPQSLHYGTMPSAPSMKAEFGNSRERDLNTSLTDQARIPVIQAEAVPLTSQVPIACATLVEDYHATLVEDYQNDTERPPPYAPGSADDSSSVLRRLNTRKAAHVVCQHCHREIMTRPVSSSDGLTIIAIIVLLFTYWPLFWLPFCFSCCKKTVHYCPFCQKQVGEKRAFIPIPVACVALVAGIFLILRFVLHIGMPHIDFDSDPEHWFDDDFHRSDHNQDTQQTHFNWPWDDLNERHDDTHETQQTRLNWPWDNSNDRYSDNHEEQQPRLNWPWDNSNDRHDINHETQQARRTWPWDNFKDWPWDD